VPYLGYSADRQIALLQTQFGADRGPVAKRRYINGIVEYRRLMAHALEVTAVSHFETRTEQDLLCGKPLQVPKLHDRRIVDMPDDRDPEEPGRQDQVGVPEDIVGVQHIDLPGSQTGHLPP